MATLTKSTGTVTLSGAVEKVALPAAFGWVWFRNMSDADMFAGLSADISEGADGVMTIPAGECGRVQTDGQDSVHLMGTGNALVVAQNYADCPFKVGGKGGEIPDLSAYAKTADVPNIKVNAAVNADTLGGKPIKDLAYITDIICGVKNGWASDSIGTVITYNDREIVKATDDLSYIGWFVNGEGWFQPIIVSQYPSGTNYTMYGQEFGYAISDGTMFDYKGRTYYACWGTFGSYQDPNVTGGFQLTVENEDYITACKTLIDNCERIEAFYAKNASIAHEVKSPNGKVQLYEDGEGGNFELTAPDGSHFMQMDLYNGTDFRMYFGNKSTGELTFPFYYKFDTGKIELNGTSDIYTVLNKPYVTGILSEQASDSPVTMSFTIFDFTPSKVICQFGNGNAFFANVVTNGFSLTIPAGTTTIHYIAFK